MVFLWENVLSLTYNSWCHQKQWVQYFPEQILFGGSRLSGVARQCQTSHISLFAQRHVCGSLVCVFNSCVFSAPQFEFLKIKGLQLFVSEGLRHGKREWRIQTVNLSIFLTAPYFSRAFEHSLLGGIWDPSVHGPRWASGTRQRTRAPVLSLQPMAGVSLAEGGSWRSPGTKLLVGLLV